MSAYGIDRPDTITWGWTPAQALIMAERIRQRRARLAADRMHETYLVVAAAQGSKPHFRQMQAEARRLRREARSAAEPEGPAVDGDIRDLVGALGVTVQRRPTRRRRRG